MLARLTLMSLPAIVLSIGLSTFAFAQATRLATMPIRIVESKPVTVDNASFVAITEAAWLAPIDEYTRTIHPVVRLRITNLTKGDLGFHTDGTYGLIVRKADGSFVKRQGGNDILIYTRPIVLPAGTSFSLVPQTELRWDSKLKAPTLFYADGTGGRFSYGPLSKGRYKLSFWYKREASDGRKPQIDGAQAWKGLAQTPPVSFEVIGAK